MKKAKRLLRNLLRAVIAIAAIANLAALFLWNYKLPDSVQSRIDNFIGIEREKAIEVGEPGEITPTEAPVQKASLIVPSQPLNYTGGNLDLKSGIYVLYEDGTRDDEPQLTTEIEEGNTRLDKIVYYTARLSDGEELTGQRAIRIGNRYTGPSLTVTGEIPEVTPEDNIRSIVREQIEAGTVFAEDGFGNDITSSIQGRLDKDKDEAGEDVYTFVLYVTNAIGDTYERVMQDDMLGTGVVMKLTTSELTLNVGTPFWYMDYVAEAHDAHGNPLDRSIHVEGIVNSYEIGDYEIRYFCVDASGVSSPVRTLKVHII